MNFKKEILFSSQDGLKDGMIYMKLVHTMGFFVMKCIQMITALQVTSFVLVLISKRVSGLVTEQLSTDHLAKSIPHWMISTSLYMLTSLLVHLYILVVFRTNVSIQLMVIPNWFSIKALLSWISDHPVSKQDLQRWKFSLSSKT